MTDDDSTSTGARITLGGVALLLFVLGGIGLWARSTYTFGLSTLAFSAVAGVVGAVLLYAAATDPEWLDVSSRVKPTEAELQERRTDEPGFEDE